MRLLVSVRSVEEAQLALDESVEIIDVKEPKKGSLGRAAWSEIQAIYEATAGRRALSVALGELADWIKGKETLTELPPVAFAKFGLAGLAGDSQWQSHWQTLWSQMPTGVIPVAVAYVDHQQCDAPSISEVVEFAGRVGCGVVLLDTFHKRRGRLLDYLSRSQLETVVERVHAAEILIALAGSISLDQIPVINETAADILAVRGAVCRSGRSGPVDREKLRKLRKMLKPSSLTV